MELPKLLQRGQSFKTPSSTRYQPAQYPAAHVARPSCQKNLWVALVLCLTCLVFLFYFLLRRGISVSSSLQHSSKGFGLVIDISQAEARINVFAYEYAGKSEILLLGSESRSIEGYSRSSGQLFHAPALLYDLLEYAKRKVPEFERPQTRIYVLGSRGLRWLSVQSRLELLQQCRSVLQGSQFQFHDDWVKVIYGSDEGVYEWVAANYALGLLQSNRIDTIGILDLGDSSAQVTFIPEELPPPAFLHQTQLWGTTHKLYSSNFDNYGLEPVSHRLLELMHSRTLVSSTDTSDSGIVIDPCTPRGYVAKNDADDLSVGAIGATTKVRSASVTGTGNFTECRAAALTMLQHGQGVCLYKKCAIGTSFVPELRGNFIATKNFYRASKFLGLPAMASIAELLAAGESYCAQEWGSLKDSHPEAKDEELRKYCFLAAYSVAFLHDSLGIPIHGNKVRFTDDVNNVPLEWTLGAFITYLAEDGIRSSPSVTIFEEFVGNLALFFVLFVFVGVLLWLVVRWRKPQLKTIYDLEKGRYIMTAIRGR